MAAVLLHVVQGYPVCHLLLLSTSSCACLICGLCWLGHAIGPDRPSMAGAKKDASSVRNPVKYLFRVSSINFKLFMSHQILSTKVRRNLCKNCIPDGLNGRT